MAKGINVPVSVPGANQAKTDLDKVAGAAKGIGDATKKTGETGKSGLEQLSSAWSAIRSSVFVALAAAIAGAAFKVAQFFDQLKTRSAEAVQNLTEVRAEMAGIFQAMGNISEASQQTTSDYLIGLMEKTRVSKEVAYPVAEAYARQFYGKIPQADYNQGLEGMVGYAARRETTATTEMIGLMPGFGIKTPAQMGEFRRMVSAAAQRAGLTEEDIVNALGRAMPTVTAMGWSYEQALTMITTLAQGQIGRQKTTFPAATMEAVMSPQETKFKEYGLNPKDTPQQIFAAVQQKAATMDRKSALKMLGDIYGTGASRGMLQLMEPMSPLTSGSAVIEQIDETNRMNTKGGITAESDAEKMKRLNVSPDEFYGTKVNEQGVATLQAQRDKRTAIRDWWNSLFTPENQLKKEAAGRAWWNSLSDTQKIKLIHQYNPEMNPTWQISPFELGPNSGLGLDIWNRMTPQQEYEASVGRYNPAAPSAIKGNPNFVGPPAPVNIQYIHQINHYPMVGNTRVGGRATPEDLGA
jgi:hypothetical protein